MISDINIHVDRDLCYACGECVDRCILDNLRLSTAPCRQACPLDLNCQGYVRLIAQGKEVEAAQELRKYTPFGAILGRICSRPCEEVCERGRTCEDGSLNIRGLKRYLADTYPEIVRSLPAKRAPASDREVAVVGSGPAGLAAAYQLCIDGHQVTVFESQGEPGGCLRYAIPAFRLPSHEVQRAVIDLEKMGIIFRTGLRIGDQVSFDELKDYHAIVVAVGAGTENDLEIPGHTLPGVVSGLDLLARARKRAPLQVDGKSVVVVGGGNTAVDAALTCRLGGASDVKIVCLEDPYEMPAYPQELQEAMETGVVIENCWGVTALRPSPEGRIRLSLARCLTVFDPDGRFSPKLDESRILHELTADLVVSAIGQRVDAEGLPGDLFDENAGRMAADPSTYQSFQHPNVFVCGDCLSGPSSVVQAMASGREAAVSVNRFLRGESMVFGRDYYTINGMVADYEVSIDKGARALRREPDSIPVHQRNLTTETEQVFTPEEAREEANRCLSCGRPFEANMTCWYCLPCEIVCPTQALRVRMPYQVR